MKKRSIIFLSALCVLAIFLCGCGSSRNEEYISNSTRIVTLGAGEEASYQLEYIKGDKMYILPFSPAFKPSLEWLRLNTRYDEKVMAWWESGHMIQGYAKRQPLAFTPCIDILGVSGWDEAKYGNLTGCDLLTNIAYAFLADTPAVMQGIMAQNNAKWVFILKSDRTNTAGMAKLLGDDPKMYYDDTGQIPGGVVHKILFQMVSGIEISGFKLAYSDEVVNIYEKV